MLCEKFEISNALENLFKFKIKTKFCFAICNLREQLPHLYPCRWTDSKFFFYATTIALILKNQKRIWKEEKIKCPDSLSL